MGDGRPRQRELKRNRVPKRNTGSDNAQSPLGKASDANSNAEVHSAAELTAKSPVMKILAGAALAIAIGAGAFFGFSGGDQISDEANADRQQQYQSLLSTGGMPLKMIASDELDAAIDSLPPSVSVEQREDILQAVGEGRIQLAWLTLWDTHVEDGDILRFESSASIPIEIVALNAKTTVAIPYPADGEVLVTGVKDGGGGITIALESGSTQILWPTMQPGDTLNLPVTPTY